MILTITAGPDGHPLEWIDTDTMTRHGVDGERPCNDTETAYVADLIAAAEAEAKARQLRADLAAGIAAFTTARDNALADRADAAAAQASALAGKALADTLKTQADAMAARTTGDTKTLAQGVAQLAALASGTGAMLANLQTWRAAVDQNAAHTDNGLIYLARLAAGLLKDPPT